MTAEVETHADDALLLEIELAAPPERVFRAISDPGKLMAWWGEEAHSKTHVWELDLRVGGKWRSAGKDDTCGAWEVSGEVLEVEPPRLLVYTWQEQVEYRPSLKSSVVRYELLAHGSGTRLRLTHSGFGENRAAFDSYRGGWPGVLELLKRHVEG